VGTRNRAACTQPSAGYPRVVPPAAGLRTGPGRGVPVRRMGLAQRLRSAPQTLEYVHESL